MKSVITSGNSLGLATFSPRCMKNSTASRIEVPDSRSRSFTAKNSAISNGDAVNPSAPSRFCESLAAASARSASTRSEKETRFRFPSTTP